jgi:hypothetical protein
MMTSKEYIDNIKKINLAEFVQCFGFEFNKIKSTRKIPVLKNAETSQTILIKQHSNGHYTFVDTDKTRKGTIIDFLQWQGINYNAIPAAIAEYKQGNTTPIKKVKVENVANRTQRREFSFRPYSEAKEGHLENRYIKPGTINSVLFSNRIGAEKRGLVCFPLYDRNGICGIQRINKRLVTGSVRGLWVANNPERFGISNNFEILITESPIDNISYEQLYGNNCYHLATIGTPTKEQLETVKLIVETTKATVLLGFDNDEVGEGYAVQFARLLEGIVLTKRVRPTMKDWNDDLKAKHKEQAQN